jgi:hypothetical protein
MDKSGGQLPSFTKGVETAGFELAKNAKINTPPAATYRFAESFPPFIFRCFYDVSLRLLPTASYLRA